jgi:hypothetical protein
MKLSVVVRQVSYQAISTGRTTKGKVGIKSVAEFFAQKLHCTKAAFGGWAKSKRPPAGSSGNAAGA